MRINKQATLVIALCLMSGLQGRSAWATDFYVDGSSAVARDDNPGIKQKPFKTISRAAQQVQPGDRVIIRPGAYPESVRLEKTGTKEKPISFIAERSGTVIVTGADPLSGWTRESGDAPVYSIPWQHDFIIDRQKQGDKFVSIRNHGADAPTGCAEQIIWDGRPLQQVMAKEQLTSGTFYVDWDGHCLYCYLPGGIDPNKTTVLGCTRSDEFCPGGDWGHPAKVEYIHVKGLTFRYAANFAQRGGVIASNGWVVEDCIVEWNNAGGITAAGNDITFLHVTARDNGFEGMSGGGSNILLRDCVSSRNNRKGFPVGWSGGGGKFVSAHHVRIENHTAYGNIGPGIWFDWDNTDITITGGKFYANYGNEQDWEGMGIFIEANNGPVLLSNNIVYSNTGAGIGLAESEHVVVEGNTLVDNGTDLALRAMEGRANHKLDDIVLRNNRFKDWRNTSTSTSLGSWNPASVAGRKIRYEGNVYAPSKQPLFSWGDQTLVGLHAVRTTLGLEAKGTINPFVFTPKLMATRTWKQQQDTTLTKSLMEAKLGEDIVLAVNGRSTITPQEAGWTCQAFDLRNNYIELVLPSASICSAIESTVAPYPMSRPVLLKVRLLQKEPGRKGIVKAVVTDPIAKP